MVDADDDPDIVSISREEAHRTIDNQIQTLNDIDSKAARILRVNLFTIGVIFTGLSVVTTSDTGNTAAPLYYSDIVNLYTVTGMIFLLFSTAVAAITYTTSSLQGGVGPNDLRTFLNNDMSDRANLEGLIEGYAEWIEYNYRTNAKNAPLGTLTLLLLIVAIALLALGAKKAATDDVGPWLLGATGVFLLAVVYFTGFIDQIARYRRVRKQ